MRCTERLIGGSCIRLAFIRESIPLKKKKNKVYNLFTFLAFRLIYIYANETFENEITSLLYQLKSTKCCLGKAQGCMGKGNFAKMAKRFQMK
jgi:hypothetical protein